uniref:RRM domain-containing protein n=1 Tax=Setaria digitata TaxID=48799 RepID=A0A915PFH7_9BILA
MPDTDFIMKCRGLPWSCTEDDLREFFGEAARSITQIKLTKDRDGRASGEGFVVFNNREDYDFALTKDKKYIGKRYVELQQVSSMESDYDDGDRRYGGSMADPNLPGRETSIVRLGGLPYGCTREEIVRFFEPLEIADRGIVMTYDRYSGKPKGEAFVAFNDDDSASKALAKNKEYIQHRYVDIYPSSYGEMLRALDGGPDPYGGGGRGWERDRRPRGLPYDRPGVDRGYRDSRMHRNGLGEKWGIAYGNRVAVCNGWLGSSELFSGLLEVWADRYGGGGDGYDDGYGGGRGGGGPMRRGWRDEPPMGGHRGYSPPRRRYTTPPPEYCIRMRGLPYRATERDIIDFFQPLRPASIDVLYEYGTDRPSGEAIVEFRNRADFDAAMQRNRNYMARIGHQFFMRIRAVMCIGKKKGRHWVEGKDCERRKIRSRRRYRVGEVGATAENYVIPVSSGRPDIDAILRDWESTYSSYRTSSIFITTFNVNGRVPSLDGIPNWLTCEGILPPDFYIIGLQEMDLTPQAFIMNTSIRHTEWKVILAKSFPKDIDYDLIHEVRLVGILLVIYRRVGSKIKVKLSEIDAIAIPTGRRNILTAALSDKGGVAISMYMNDTSVCFVNAHFAAHIDGNAKRVMDYKNIVKGIHFRRNGKSLFEHDVVFWFGDLNFRLDTAYGMSNNELRKLCSDDEAFRDMIVYDQLKRAMKFKIIFKDFKEPEILNFRPTFKYDINSDNWDSSVKKRVPAWCDRILWWNQKGVRIRQKFYESIPSIRFSDHRPVRALFYLGVRKIDFTEYSRAYRRALREANYSLNNYQDEEESSGK